MDVPEALQMEGIDVHPVSTLARLVSHFHDYYPIEPYWTVIDLDADPPAYAADFTDIKGQISIRNNSWGFTVIRSWAEAK